MGRRLARRSGNQTTTNQARVSIAVGPVLNEVERPDLHLPGGLHRGVVVILPAALIPTSAFQGPQGQPYSLRCRHIVVGTRFCASAARPDVGRALREQRSLPREPTTFQCDLAKKSTLESMS